MWVDGRISMALALIPGAFQEGVRDDRRENVVATALWSVDVLGVGDHSFLALGNMARSTLDGNNPSALDAIVARRQELVRSQTRSGLILVRQ
jgi:hypothetical protein